MSNFNPADWAIAALRPGVPTPADEAAMELRFRLRHTAVLIKLVEKELEDRRAKRLLLEAEASGRAVRLDAENVVFERLADFIENSPGCRATVNEETGELVLVCPDVETASLARLAL